MMLPDAIIRVPKVNRAMLVTRRSKERPELPLSCLPTLRSSCIIVQIHNFHMPLESFKRWGLLIIATFLQKKENTYTPWASHTKWQMLDLKLFIAFWQFWMKLQSFSNNFANLLSGMNNSHSLLGCCHGIIVFWSASALKTVPMIDDGNTINFNLNKILIPHISVIKSFCLLSLSTTHFTTHEKKVLQCNITPSVTRQVTWVDTSPLRHYHCSNKWCNPIITLIFFQNFAISVIIVIWVSKGSFEK